MAKLLVLFAFVVAATVICSHAFPGMDFPDSLPVELEIPPPTVSELSVSSFLGRWFEMYSSVIPKATFEKGGFCTTADYFNDELTADGEIRFEVTNSQK